MRTPRAGWTVDSVSLHLEQEPLVPLDWQLFGAVLSLALCPCSTRLSGAQSLLGFPVLL